MYFLASYPCLLETLRCSINLCAALVIITLFVTEDCAYFGYSMHRVKLLNLKTRRVSISPGERRSVNKVTILELSLNQWSHENLKHSLMEKHTVVFLWAKLLKKMLHLYPGLCTDSPSVCWYNSHRWSVKLWLFWNYEKWEVVSQCRPLPWQLRLAEKALKIIFWFEIS